MPIKFNPEKVYNIKYEDPIMGFALKIKFPYLEKDHLVEDGTGPLEFILNGLKDWILDTEGIIDENTNEKIELTENSRRAIVDIVRTLPSYLIQIAVAFIGPFGKNLLTGVTQSLTTDGHPTNADHASLNSVETKKVVS